MLMCQAWKCAEPLLVHFATCRTCTIPTPAGEQNIMRFHKMSFKLCCYLILYSFFLLLLHVLFTFHSGSLLMDHWPQGASISPGSYGWSYPGLHWTIALLSLTICLYLYFCNMWCLFTLIFSVSLLIILRGLPFSRSPRWRGGRVARAQLGRSTAVSVDCYFYQIICRLGFLSFCSVHATSSACLYILGEQSPLRGSSWGFFHLFLSRLKGFCFPTWQVFPQLILGWKNRRFH